MMSLTFGLFTQVSGSGPLGPLVVIKTGALIRAEGWGHLLGLIWYSNCFCFVCCVFIFSLFSLFIAHYFHKTFILYSPSPIIFCPFVKIASCSCDIQ